MKPITLQKKIMLNSGLLAQSMGVLLLLVSANGQCPTGPAPECQDAQVQIGNYHMGHEVYCELFYKCNSGLSRFTQRCGHGTLFDSSLSVCVTPGRANCPQWSCDASSQGRKYPALCNDEYYECTNSGYKKKNCTSGEIFDCAAQACSTTATTEDHDLCARGGSGNDPSFVCYDVGDPNGNPCVYTTRWGAMEFNDRPCPHGTSFNESTCQCSTFSSSCPPVPPTRYSDVKLPDPDCKPSFKLDFSLLPLEATSEKLKPVGSNVTLPYECKTIGVSVIDDWAVFRTVPATSSSALVYCYFLARNELSGPWAMKLRLQLQNVGTSGAVKTTPFTLITNNYNSTCTPTFTVTLIYSGGQFTLTITATGTTRSTGAFVGGTTTGSITMPATNILDIILLFDGSISAQLVDRGSDGTGNTCVDVQATSYLGDIIATTACGFTIGEGLNGRIDYFYIHEGCGDLSLARVCPALRSPLPPVTIFSTPQP